MTVRKIIESFSAKHPEYSELIDDYTPDKEAVESIKANIQGISIKLFHGDWCPDCRVQIPAFLSVMAAVDKDDIDIGFIEMDRNKEDVLGDFIRVCCLVGPQYRCGAKQLFDAFVEFSGDRAMTQRRFGDLLGERGFGRQHSGRIWRLGITLATNYLQD